MPNLGDLSKILIVFAALLASASVAYYYVYYLPHRDALLDNERHESEARAERQRIEQEQRAQAERDAAEEKKALQAENAQQRYVSCLTFADKAYDSQWAGQCKINAARVERGLASCIQAGISKVQCAASYGVANPGSDCSLPSDSAKTLNEQHDKDKAQCFREYQTALQQPL